MYPNYYRLLLVVGKTPSFLLYGRFRHLVVFKHGKGIGLGESGHQLMTMVQRVTTH